MLKNYLVNKIVILKTNLLNKIILKVNNNIKINNNMYIFQWVIYFIPKAFSLGGRIFLKFMSIIITKEINQTVILLYDVIFCYFI